MMPFSINLRRHKLRTHLTVSRSKEGSNCDSIHCDSADTFFACFTSPSRLPKVRRLLFIMLTSHGACVRRSSVFEGVSRGGTDNPFFASAQRLPCTCRSRVNTSAEHPALCALSIRLSF